MSFFSFNSFAGEFKTWQDLKFEKSVRQKYDFSCGVASLVTLLNFQFGERYDEKEILVSFLESLPEKRAERVKQDGLSLLELKELAEFLGYKVYVVKLSFQDLAKTPREALIYMEIPNYRHFVIFRGFKNGKVFLSDPALGQRSILPEEFIKIWKGRYALFLDHSEKQITDRLKVKEKELILPQYLTIHNILN